MGTTLKQQPYIQQIPQEWHDGKLAEIAMLRLDVVHPVISGNKYYKLKENITRCKELGKDAILTFGGGYSNHLIATAAMAQVEGLRSIGIVRGIYEELTPTLAECTSHGMELRHISISDYKQKNDKEWLKQLSAKYDHPYIIPEGGANEEGRAGAGDIAPLVPGHYTHIAVSAGTGTTLAGIINNTNVPVYGFAPMKKGSYIADDIRQFITTGRRDAYSVYDEWHCGGFGKYNRELIDFMNDFYQVTGIPLDMVYTAKMMMGIKQLVQGHVFSSTDRLLCIHTGGLQGNSSVKGQLIY